ncbi:MAG: hypothetical protein JW839_20355 [Candidatus Lokiarchaeota archaeon]|nr:hypothetical protein [Candidatus Lokiarchaeota archaeon]
MQAIVRTTARANELDEYRLTPIDAVGEGVVLFGDEWVRPYKQRHAELVEHGMRKTDCALIPPSL